VVTGGSGCQDVAMGARQPEVDGGRSGFAAPTGDDARRLQQLAKVTTELGAVETMSGVVEAAVNHAGEAIRAAVATLMVREGDRLVMVGGYGLQPGIAERWHSFPVDHDNPASEALRQARPVSMAEVPVIEQRYPALVGQVPAGRSIVCLPLGAGAAPVGVLGVTFEDAWLPGPGELAFLTTFAEACGQAIRRVRASFEAAERARQLTFLAQASAELGSSLDYRSTLAKVASLVVPDLADWCAVDVLEAGELTTLAVAHVDPAKVAWAWEMQRRYPPDRDAATGAPNVTRTGASELYEEITDEMLVAGARDEEHLRLSRGLHLRSAMVVPLAAHGRTMGAITLLRADSDRAYTKSDLAVAEDLGRRAGIAVDNALLHSQTRDVALQLQRAVLPDSLDKIEGWEVAAYYEPGGRAEVGGDFYDAIPLPDGRLAVLIGDVMGHGVPAAAAMAQLRASVRAFVSVDPTPSVVIAKLERMFALYGIVQLVSLVYGLVDPAREELVLVNAGHYPPVIVRASGTVEFAESAPRRPLGADPDKCGATAFSFTAADTLFLFTDGLIERRSEVIDTGMARLRAHARILGRPALSAALAELVRCVHGGDGDDDVTALALRKRS
jgi:GAF domain-containing protein